MESVKDYLTIAEYSERAGITKQAVYKQLDGKLKQYLRMVDGKKCLDISVLEIVPTADDSTEENKLIIFFRNELDNKNKEIEQLQSEKTRLFNEVERLHDEITMQQQLLNQEQQLHAQTYNRLQLIEDKSIDPPVQKHTPESEAAAERKTKKEPAAEILQPVQKSGFFSRFFRK